MTIKFCPNCNQSYVAGFDACDFVHTCNSGNPVLDQEDVVITGDWEDFSGEGTRASQEVLNAGIINELQGTRAGFEGEDKQPLTRRGRRASTRRQRQHLHFIKFGDKNDKN